MPMSFPDFESLKKHARMCGFREPIDGETEASYRMHLHEHVKPLDKIESYEILFGRGWDEWSDAEQATALLGALADRIK